MINSCRSTCCKNVHNFFSNAPSEVFSKKSFPVTQIFCWNLDLFMKRIAFWVGFSLEQCLVMKWAHFLSLSHDRVLRIKPRLLLIKSVVSKLESTFGFFQNQALWALSNGLIKPRGNGVMDSALACCAGGPGSIPAVGKSNFCNIQMVSPSRYKVVG